MHAAHRAYITEHRLRADLIDYFVHEKCNYVTFLRSVLLSNAFRMKKKKNFEIFVTSDLLAAAKILSVQ
jgi:hypothetical protein